MKKPYLVYLSSSNDVWVSDAYTWFKKNGYKEEDFEEIISEKVFYCFLSRVPGPNIFENRPVMFVTERQKDNDFRK